MAFRGGFDNNVVSGGSIRTEDSPLLSGPSYGRDAVALDKVGGVSPEHMAVDNAPPDRFGAAYFCFLLLGIGLLFPWNAFLTALGYFMDLYPDYHMAFLLPLAFNWPQIIVLLLNIRWGPMFSFTSRLMVGFAVNIVIQLITPFIESFGLSEEAGTGITLAGAFITGCCASILFGTVLGVAALFPPRFTGAVMVGNGVAGILAGGLQIIAYASISNQQYSAIMYFCISAGLLFCCIIGYFVLLTLPITKYYLLLQKATTKTEDSQIQDDNVASKNFEQKKVHYLGLLGRVWREALVVFSVFFVTLSLFPGITASIKTTTDLSTGWFTILYIFTFQVFDFVGRSLPRFFVLFSPRWLWVPTAARFVFFPLFILCVKPLIFKSDAFYYIFMFIFAISNGYCGTLAMMYGPVNALDHEKEVAGIVMGFFLNFGIFIASHFGLVLNYAVTGEIPWENAHTHHNGTANATMVAAQMFAPSYFY